jgi:hypothetical protein
MPALLLLTWIGTGTVRVEESFAALYLSSWDVESNVASRTPLCLLEPKLITPM